MENNHELLLKHREFLSINGIKKILNFDSKIFTIDSNMGVIEVNGKNLELLALDTEGGHIKIKGNINKINYLDKQTKEESFIAKLFK